MSFILLYSLRTKILRASLIISPVSVVYEHFMVFKWCSSVKVFFNAYDCFLSLLNSTISLPMKNVDPRPWTFPLHLTVKTSLSFTTTYLSSSKTSIGSIHTLCKPAKTIF